MSAAADSVSSFVFDMGIAVGSLDVVDETVSPGINYWEDQHFEQGFSWSPGNVSFGTITDAGIQRVEVRTADEIELKPTAKRAIVVPFSVSSSSRIIVTNIYAIQMIDFVPAGSYALIFETGDDDELWCRLTFVRSETAEPAVLIADDELSLTTPLLMEAEPLNGR